MVRIGLFPGQGSQAVGMGKGFIESRDEAQELCRIADKSLGFSLSALCLEGPLETLTLTANAQPAILLVSTICHRLAQIPIEAAAGHSLGEFSAHVAAGTVSFEDAIQLVHKRGRYMQEAVSPGAGKMLAVMGPSEAELRELLGGLDRGICEIANLNSPGQTVVAGDVAGVDRFAELLGTTGAKVIPLNVSAPFHCRLMQPAAEKLARDLDATTFADPRVPVIANVTATPVTTAAEAKERLKEQVCGTVRWTGSMEYAAEQMKVTDAIEFGAGGVLTKLLKRIVPGVKRHELSDPKSLEAVRPAVG